MDSLVTDDISMTFDYHCASILQFFCEIEVIYSLQFLLIINKEKTIKRITYSMRCAFVADVDICH